MSDFSVFPELSSKVEPQSGVNTDWVRSSLEYAEGMGRLSANFYPLDGIYNIYIFKT